jgi:hypothetical protein
MTVDHPSYLTQVIEIWIPEYPVHAISGLLLDNIKYSPVKATSALKGAPREGEVWEVKLSIPIKDKSALTTSDTLPSKDLRWPEYGQQLLTAKAFRQLFTYCFEKKGLGSQDIQECLCKNLTKVTLIKPFDTRRWSYSGHFRHLKDPKSWTFENYGHKEIALYKMHSSLL